MKVISNLLCNDAGVPVPFKKSPNTGGVLVPSYLIIHYDGSPNSTGAISWMISKEAKVSAHLHITREGVITQLVPFNVVAWHAGVSSWKGIVGMNSHSIGIELQNSGNQEYTKIQLDVLEQVAKALVGYYKLKEILGHSDIAPGRKIDPGKQFPMIELRREVYGTPTEISSSIRTTSNVNLRKGAGTQFESLKVIPANTPVTKTNDSGEWSVVEVEGLKGFINSKYLTTK